MSVLERNRADTEDLVKETLVRALQSFNVIPRCRLKDVRMSGGSIADGGQPEPLGSQIKAIAREIVVIFGWSPQQPTVSQLTLAAYTTS